jgi:hypothetical protein
MSHEQSEVALEMRAHGALGDVEGRALDEHLKVCGMP